MSTIATPAHAMKYLSVCATSSPSEHIFSVSGNIVTRHCNHLKPKMVDNMGFFVAEFIYSRAVKIVATL